MEGGRSKSLVCAKRYLDGIVNQGLVSANSPLVHVLIGQDNIWQYIQRKNFYLIVQGSRDRRETYYYHKKSANFKVTDLLYGHTAP